MNPIRPFIIHDTRCGDMYYIHHLSGKFLFAERIIGGAVSQPLTYDRLADVPVTARGDIEQKLIEMGQ